MKRQIWFQTDLGYEATKAKLFRLRDALGDFQDNRGRLSKGMKDFTVQITTQGKLGIFYPETAGYNVILERLKPYLVKADGSPAQIIERIEISEKTQKLSEEQILRKIEEYFEKHPYWHYKAVLSDNDLKLICAELRLNPESTRTRDFVYRAYFKVRKPPAIL